MKAQEYKCNHCDIIVDRKEHLKVHIQNKHTYYWDEGEYDTTLKEAMDRHRTTVHKMNVSRGD